MIDQKKVDEMLNTLIDALAAVDPPEEVAIYVLLSMAVSIATHMGGPERARELMTEILKQPHFMGPDVNPNYGRKN
jgi:hypothetical protein